MLIRFREIYFKNSKSKPFLEIIGTDLKVIFDNFSYVSKIEDSYLINIQYGAFDILNDNTLKIIENILEKNSLQYIDKYIFEEHLKNKYEYEMKTYNKTTMLEKIKPRYQAISTNEPTQQTSKYIFPVENELTELYKSGEYDDYNNSYKVSVYETSFSNQEEYLYNLLNIIFNCNFHFIIKRCEKCKNFFISNTPNTKKCPRKDINSISCNKYAEKVRKQHQYDDPIKHLIKNVRDKLKNEEELSEFNEELKQKKKDFLYDNKSLVNWLLKQYYYTPKGRQAVIERLGLSKYL